MSKQSESDVGRYESICMMKQELQKLKESHSIYTSDEDIITLANVLDGLVFVVGQIDADLRKDNNE